MLRRRGIIAGAFVLIAAAVAIGVTQFVAPSAQTDAFDTDLPIPPFPPRVAEGADYEACLSTLAVDPTSAVTLSDSLAASGGGDGAAHCHGLALIATGRPATGAAELEALADHTGAAPLARALLLGQAAQGRLMVGQADQAAEDATRALSLAPDDTELLIMRATAKGQRQDYTAAVTDLTSALRLDPMRTDALVNRAVMRRKLDQLDLAQADVSRALAQDPDDADALLERGILRERMGDRSGARADWERARSLDPNGTTADLAVQNLALLDAGQARE